MTKKMPHVTVVGDLILDRYLIGDATKLNPEQPGVVICVDKEEDRLGGAAAVAMLSTSFGARLTLAGVVGTDEPGKRLLQLLHAYGIEPHVWIDDRPTTWKQRIVARGQLRPDRYDREVTTPIGDEAERFLSSVPLGDVLLIADYGKGVCTMRLLRSLIGWARKARIPLLVDPARGRDWRDYEGCTLIKSNRVEAAEALSVSVNEAPTMMARRLAIRHTCRVVVTAGELGLCWSDGEKTHCVPAVPVEVRDVCGAGDAVLASLGISLALGKSLDCGCREAVESAARQVRYTGVAASFCTWTDTPVSLGGNFGQCRKSTFRAIH
jgi:D-beta-D-heptose 7-phosphate kinase/D-beta-D-heptose 1-phosphate adenosyltransferase